MSLFALFLSYFGVAIVTVIGCRLAGQVDGGCDGSQFDDVARPYDWDLDGAFDDRSQLLTDRIMGYWFNERLRG